MFSLVHASPGFAVVSKPPNVPMDGELAEGSTATKTTTTTVQRFTESEEGKKMMFVAMHPPTADQTEIEQEDDENNNNNNQDESQNQNNNSSNRKRKPNTKDIVDGKMRFVHQLDYSTSGLLCLAFSKRIAAKLAFCFESRSTRKEYLAILVSSSSCSSIETESEGEQDEGVWLTQEILDAKLGKTQNQPQQQKEEISFVPENDLPFMSNNNSKKKILARSVINYPVGYDPEDERNFKMRAVVLSSGTNNNCEDENQNEKMKKELEIVNRMRNSDNKSVPKEAGTVLTVLEHGFFLAEKDEEEKEEEGAKIKRRRRRRRIKVNLVHLQLLTGRRHQLRVHCAAVGFPILDDPLYGCGGSSQKQQQETNERGGGREQSRMMLQAWRLTLPRDAIGAAKSRLEEIELTRERRRGIKTLRKENQKKKQQLLLVGDENQQKHQQQNKKPELDEVEQDQEQEEGGEKEEEEETITFTDTNQLCKFIDLA